MPACPPRVQGYGALHDPGRRATRPEVEDERI